VPGLGRVKDGTMSLSPRGKRFICLPLPVIIVRWSILIPPWDFRTIPFPLFTLGVYLSLLGLWSRVAVRPLRRQKPIFFRRRVVTPPLSSGGVERSPSSCGDVLFAYS